jgi:hypothetical protein
MAMTMASRVICVIGLLVAGVAGCASLDISGLFSFESDSSGKDRVIAGSLESVAYSTQATLNQMGLATVVSRKAETVRISSRTSSGASFAMVLTREKTKDGEQTRVRIEWDGAADEPMAGQILAKLQSAPKS